MNKYLLEIGTEELPYKFVNTGVAQLKSSFEKLLKENQIDFTEIKSYSTPRRLTIIIEGFEEKQPDTVKTVKGPILNIAYDENGNLTKAGQGFAKKNGVDESSLYKEDNYVWAKVEQKGKSIKDILEENAEKIVLKMQGPYFMRWADLDVKFQRPIRWVVSLLNDDELKIKIADVESSRFSRGHRFKSDKVEIKNPDHYEKALFENKSLLPSGIIFVKGNFNEKEVVLVTDKDGNGLLKAVTNFNAGDLRALAGHKSSEIDSILGKGKRDVVFRPEDTSPVEHNV